MLDINSLRKHRLNLIKLITEIEVKIDEFVDNCYCQEATPQALIEEPSKYTLIGARTTLAKCNNCGSYIDFWDGERTIRRYGLNF